MRVCGFMSSKMPKRNVRRVHTQWRARAPVSRNSCKYAYWPKTNWRINQKITERVTKRISNFMILWWQKEWTKKKNQTSTVMFGQWPGTAQISAYSILWFHTANNNECARTCPRTQCALLLRTNSSTSTLHTHTLNRTGYKLDYALFSLVSNTEIDKVAIAAIPKTNLFVTQGTMWNKRSILTWRTQILFSFERSIIPIRYPFMFKTKFDCDCGHTVRCQVQRVTVRIRVFEMCVARGNGKGSNRFWSDAESWKLNVGRNGRSG